jgi:GAF domain-containing protein
LDVDELINTSVNLIRDQFGFYYVGLFLVDEAKEWAVLRAGTGEAGQLQLAQGHKLKVGGESMIGWSIQNRKARIALDVGQDAVRFKNPALPDTHSEMALPLMSGKEVLGALTVQSTERGAFSDEDITLLQTMADQLAIAIKNARLFENVVQTQAKAETRLQETLALQQLSAALASTLQINEILQLFFEACIKEIGFEYVQFCLVDILRNRIRAIAGVGVSESNIKRANRSLDSNDILADVIRTGKTEILSGWDHRFHKETYEAEGHAHWVRVFMPIKLQQENIGVVEAGFNKDTKKKFESAQIRLLKAFINQTALAIDNAQRYEASLKQAKREALIKEITTKVRASTDLDAILQTTVKEVGDAIGSRRTSIQLVSSSKDSDPNGTSAA